ncbi:MAG: hypothetical protein A2Y97_14410 [Nitrospirae bacterium RBG_13_39_12]|nr:MAG: hypothetical protein A2Y97_14410 [Nitrospirae bacterium RBG_13_39_12]
MSASTEKYSLKETMVDVSLIVLNYHGKEFISDCLKSIEAQSFKNFELIIVDNASKDSSLDLIEDFKKKSGLKIKTVYLSNNKGFAGGNIEGLRHAEGKYIALLNNDTEADKNWLSELVKAMDAHHAVGICASRLVVYGTDIIDSAGDCFSTFLKGFKRGEGEKSFLFNKMEYVFGACAGAALYRWKTLDEIGFLDEDFFLIHEDTDLNFRAQLAGWKVLYVPEAVTYHKVRSSIGEKSDIAVYHTLRNAEYVIIKNVPLPLFLRRFPQYILRTITEILYFAVKHGRPLLYFRAKTDAMKMLLKMMKKRKDIMRGKKVSNGYLVSIMSPVAQNGFLKKKAKKFLCG